MLQLLGPATGADPFRWWIGLGTTLRFAGGFSSGCGTGPWTTSNAPGDPAAREETASGFPGVARELLRGMIALPGLWASAPAAETPIKYFFSYRGFGRSFS